MTLFPTPASPPAETLSADQKRTRRRRALLEAGIHPATETTLRGDGETCGSCGHARKVNRWWKCGLVPVTSGPGTDIRVSWPACRLWEGAEK